MMTKDEFVRRMMSDMAKKRREKIRKEKSKEMDIIGYILENHRRIEKSLNIK